MASSVSSLQTIDVETDLMSSIEIAKSLYLHLESSTRRQNHRIFSINYAIIKTNTGGIDEAAKLFNVRISLL